MKYQAGSQATPTFMGNASSGRPDPEVPEKKPRRRYTAQYKIRILNEIDACNKQGRIGVILRRERPIPFQHSYLAETEGQRAYPEEARAKGQRSQSSGQKSCPVAM